MAYLGTPPRSRVLSSADIDPGSISLDDISFTDQPTNLNLTGTYDKHTMRLADGVTVVGDVTISDNLILSKISDDGNAITLTNDSSTRTITGTGSLEASTLTQTPNASLTGMTGEIGSSVVFPTGTPIQYVTSRIEGGSRGHNTKTIANRSEIHSDYRSSIIPKGANSKILIRYSSRATYVNNVSAHWAIGYEVTASGGTATASTLKDQLVAGEADDADSYFTTQHTTATYRALTMEVFHTPSYTVGQKIWYGVISYATGWHYLELHGDVDIVITEIVG